jgi:hypothetical protein
MLMKKNYDVDQEEQVEIIRTRNTAFPPIREHATCDRLWVHQINSHVIQEQLMEKWQFQVFNRCETSLRLNSLSKPLRPGGQDLATELSPGGTTIPWTAN